MKKMLFLLFAIIFALSGKSYAQFFNTVVSVGGQIYNGLDKKPISVNIELFDAKGVRIQKVKSNSKDGSYFITSLKPGNSYELKVSEFDYMRQTFPIVVPNTDKYLEVSKDMLLIPKKIGTEIPIRVKLFENNKTNLKNGADVFLSDYLSLLKQNPTVKVRIVSYPDTPGDATKNGQLTQERSESIKKYFLANGIEPDRLVAQNATIIDPKNPIPTGKASKGKKYVGLSYLIIDAY